MDSAEFSAGFTWNSLPRPGGRERKRERARARRVRESMRKKMRDTERHREET